MFLWFLEIENLVPSIATFFGICVAEYKIVVITSVNAASGQSTAPPWKPTTLVCQRRTNPIPVNWSDSRTKSRFVVLLLRYSILLPLLSTMLTHRVRWLFRLVDSLVRSYSEIRRRQSRLYMHLAGRPRYSVTSAAISSSRTMKSDVGRRRWHSIADWTEWDATV